MMGKNRVKAAIYGLCMFTFAGCVSEKKESSLESSQQTVINTTSEKTQSNETAIIESVEQVLSQNHHCNAAIIIRSQSLTAAQIENACQVLVAQEAKFHQVFGTEGKPVADDNNDTMRANIYADRESFVKYATAHFSMPTDNGGMYLEGYPDKVGNRAEFVAYQRNGEIWNLNHEFVHYLDGRFNKYGDYCNGLHDDHAGPEFCPVPHRAYPHIVWWAEGMAEYLAHGKNNQEAVAIGKNKTFQLSELFNTSSNENTGTERVYRWGYLAVRFMMENHRNEIEKMLGYVRIGDWDGYQNLVKTWGTGLDNEFQQWLAAL